MLSNVALDVSVGLVFIYLLYSLLATIIVEIIATKLGLRARNLREAINRMLNDETEKKGKWKKFLDSVNFLKNPNNEIIKNFYNHPEIKYLGSSGVFSNPSSFKAVSFSKTLMYLLNGKGTLNRFQIKEALEKKAPKVLGEETAAYVLSLYEEANGDVAKFKMQLESWFDRTMEQATEWYKRKIQIILLILGFFIAWMFNADTFTIIKRLSQDKDAREKLVTLATAYVQNNPVKPNKALQVDSLNSSNLRSYNEKLDSLLSVKEKLEEDIANASGLLGTGSWLPDSVLFVKKDKIKSVYVPAIEYKLIPDSILLKGRPGNYLVVKDYKWEYFFGILGSHFWGFLITALALSLGAPFWFDLLNKLMKLRTSIKQGTESTNTNPDNTVRHING